MTAALTPAGLVLSGALDIRHRYYRLLGSLEEAKLAADLGTRAVLDAMSDDCRERMLEHAHAVRGQVIAAKARSKTASWSDTYLSQIVDRSVNGFTSLTAKHAEVYLQLQDSRKVREDLRYLLYRALNLSLVSSRHEGLVSLKTSGNLQWETTAFRSDGGTTASVSVPWLDSLGPLRWPLVVHEVAHYFLPFGDEANDLYTQIAQENGWNADAFEEIVADAVAQRHFGAAYSFALAREGYLYSFRKHVTGGLSVEQRLRALNDPADLLEALPAQWGLAQRNSLGETPEGIPDDQVTDMRNKAEEILSDLARVHELDPHLNREDAVASGIELLLATEPAPAVQKSTAAEAVEKAIAAREADPNAEVADVAQAAVHIPLTDGEIFEAAWRAEVCRDPDELVRVLGSEMTDEVIEIELAEVTKQDIWLARSLQSAAVHRWLVETMALSDAS
jgi:hypothetical protein